MNATLSDRHPLPSELSGCYLREGKHPFHNKFVDPFYLMYNNISSDRYPPVLNRDPKLQI